MVWRRDGEEQEAVFAGVMIANGTLSEPNLPAFEGSFADPPSDDGGCHGLGHRPAE